MKWGNFVLFGRINVKIPRTLIQMEILLESAGKILWGIGCNHSKDSVC